MTVASVPRKQIFFGSGSTGPFTFNFRILDRDDITVTKIAADGTKTILTRVGGGFSIVLTNGGQNGGAITLTVALAVGETLVIQGATPVVQPTPFANQGAFFAIKHENSYDRLTLVAQEQADSLTSSIKINRLDSNINTELPVLTPLSVVTVNATANGFSLASISALAGATAVILTGLLNDDFLEYNSSVTAFVNRTPAVVKQKLNVDKFLQSLGTSIVAAATTDIGAATSDFITITGNTGITALGTTTTLNHVWTRFTGTPIITYNATTLLTPGLANYQVVAGDILEWVRGSAAANWVCVNGYHADGTPIAPFNTNSLTSYSTPTLTDYLDAWSSAASGNRKILPADFLKVVNSLTEDTVPDTASDFALCYDSSTGTASKVRLSNIGAVQANVQAKRTTTQAITLNVWNTINWYAEDFKDLASLHDTSTNPSRFTAAVAGIYEINAIIVTSNAGNKANAARVTKNGSYVTDLPAYNVNTTGGVDPSAGAGNTYPQPLHGFFQLAINDYVEVQVQTNTSENVLAASRCFFRRIK